MFVTMLNIFPVLSVQVLKGVDLLIRGEEYGGERTTLEDGTSDSGQQERPALPTVTGGGYSPHRQTLIRERVYPTGIIWCTT